MAIHTQAIKNLTPADYLKIEEEHEGLEKFLRDLHDTCCNLDNLSDCKSCSREQLASCRGRLSSFFYDLIELAGKHFHHEESIMLSRPHITEDDDYFRDHRQAHANLIRGLHATVNECYSFDQMGNTDQGYRQFHHQISELFGEHTRSFDDPFIQSTK